MRIDPNGVFPAQRGKQASREAAARKAGIQIVAGAEDRKLRCFASMNKLGSSFRWNDEWEEGSLLSIR